MKKLEDYYILDLDYNSSEFIARQNSTSSPDSEFGLLENAKLNMEEVKKELTTLLNNPDVTDLLNSEDQEIYKPAFKEFLIANKGGFDIDKSIDFGIFEREPYSKYLISNRQTAWEISETMSGIVDLKAAGNSHQVIILQVLANILSEELYKEFLIISNHSNLIDTLKWKRFTKAVFAKFDKSKYGKESKEKIKESNAERESVGFVSDHMRERYEEMTIEEKRAVLIKFREREAFSFRLSSHKLPLDIDFKKGTEAESFLNSIDAFFVGMLDKRRDYFEGMRLDVREKIRKRIIKKHKELKKFERLEEFKFDLIGEKSTMEIKFRSGPIAKAFIDHLHKFFNEVLSEELDYYDNKSPEEPRNIMRVFIGKWANTILDFVYDHYDIGDNREGGYTSRQLAILWALFSIHKLSPNYKNGFDTEKFRDWLDKICTKTSRKISIPKVEKAKESAEEINPNDRARRPEKTKLRDYFGGAF